MITKIRTKGSSDTSMLSPPNMPPCAKAGVISMNGPWLRRLTRRRLPPRRAPEMCAEYSGQPPNCNAAQSREQAAKCLEIPGLSAVPCLRAASRPAKGAATDGSHGKVEITLQATGRQVGEAQPRLGTDRADVLERIAAGLERLAPPAPGDADLAAADAFVWHPKNSQLAPVQRVNRVEMALLKGIDRVRDTLVENTERFARGLPANNALLWGARGMGKSSLVKAAHAGVNAALKRNGDRRRSSSSKSTARTSKACPT